MSSRIVSKQWTAAVPHLEHPPFRFRLSEELGRTDEIDISLAIILVLLLRGQYQDDDCSVIVTE